MIFFFAHKHGRMILNVSSARSFVQVNLNKIGHREQHSKIKWISASLQRTKMHMTQWVNMYSQTVASF